MRKNTVNEKQRRKMWTLVCCKNRTGVSEFRFAKVTTDGTNSSITFYDLKPMGNTMTATVAIFGIWLNASMTPLDWEAPHRTAWGKSLILYHCHLFPCTATQEKGLQYLTTGPSSHWKPPRLPPYGQTNPLEIPYCAKKCQQKYRSVSFANHSTESSVAGNFCFHYSILVMIHCLQGALWSSGAAVCR